MRKFVAFAVASLLATPAMAQDIGVRAEAHAGYDRVKLGLEVDGDAYEGAEDGIGYGAEVGLDIPVSNTILVGPYAGIDFSDTDYCERETGLYEICLDTGRSLSAGLQLTAAMGAKAALFAKVGYTNGRLVGTYVDYEDAAYSDSGKLDRDGLQVGAGVRYALGRNAYVSTQLVYNDYNDEEASLYGYDVRAYGSRVNVLGGLGVRF